MSEVAPSNPAPPPEVIAEFLHSLGQIVQPGDRIVPVLRGSVLLRHWFGDAARPAADVDLEWFPLPGWEVWFAENFDHARRLCMLAVMDHEAGAVAFDAYIPVPDQSASLWEYDTPGTRCYTGWRWPERDLSGVLQVDLAQAPDYELAALATETIELDRAGEEPARPLAYAPETLLAAKLSWIVRHVQRSTAPDGRTVLAFLGLPKDLFDAHLLLTRGHLRPDVFQDVFLAVSRADKLDGNLLELLLDPRLAPHVDDAAPAWTDFAARHDRLLREPPVEMLRTTVALLRPLLDDVRPHLPFLHSIAADPLDEANLLVYADWLEEQADPRTELVRLYCRFHFHRDRSVGLRLAPLLDRHRGWLHHLAGGAERFRALRMRVETA